MASNIRSITSPNYKLFDWLDSIPVERRTKTYFEVGIHCRNLGFSIPTLRKCFYQLNSHSEVKLGQKLSDEEVLLLTRRIGNVCDNDASTDTHENEVFSDTSSETDDEVQKLLESNTVRPKSDNAVAGVCKGNENFKVSDYEGSGIGKKSECSTGNSSEVHVPSGSTTISALSNGIIESKSLTDNPIEQGNCNVIKETHFEDNSAPCNASEDSSIDKNKSVIDKHQIDERSPIQETISQLILATDPSSSDEIGVEENALVNDKPQTVQRDVREQRNQATVSGRSPSDNSSNKGNASIIDKPDKPQIVQSNISKDKSIRNINTIESVDFVAVKVKPNDTEGKRKSVIMKSAGDGLVKTNVNNEISIFPIDKSSHVPNKLRTLNQDKKIINDNNLNDIETTSLKHSEGSKEIGGKAGLSISSEEAKSLNIKTKPSIDSDCLIVMQNLKEQLAKNLSKKNIHLPLSGYLSVPTQSSTKKTEGTGQKPLISVRKNLFETPSKCPETMRNSSLLKDDNVPEPLNSNIGGPHSSKTGNKDKPKEYKVHKGGKSGPVSSLQNSHDLEEGLKQINAQLYPIKKMVESKKRHVSDLGDKIENVKRRRLSEQNVTQGRSLLESVSDLARRQSSAGLENDILLKSLLAQPNTASTMNPSTKDGISLPELLKNVSTDITVTASNLLQPRVETQPVQSAPQARSVPTQAAPNPQPVGQKPTVYRASVPTEAAPNPQPVGQKPTVDRASLPTQAAPNPLTVSQDKIVERACKQFLIYFANGSDNNFGSIPAQVRYSIDQYTQTSAKRTFTRVTEYLQLYLMFYKKFFDNEEIRKTICKIAELLHLSVADYHRRYERKRQAERLQSAHLRKEEIERAQSDYQEILNVRGRQFGDMFKSVISSIKHVQQFPMMFAFYFKITQALSKIDKENASYVYTLRDLMKSLLMSGMPDLQSHGWPFFTINNEDFQNNCKFVKQCQLSLYISGHSDADTANFWELVSCNPVIHTLERIMTDLKSSTPTNSSGVSSSSTASTVVSSIQAEHPQKNTCQIPSNVYQQTNADTSNPFILTGQNTLVQRRTQPVQQSQPFSRQTFTIPRNTTQLPSFASLNSPQVAFQQYTQRNQPVSSIQNQTVYQQQNVQHIPVAPQTLSSRPNVRIVPQTLSSRPNVRIVPTHVYPPPPYPGTATQQSSHPQTNQPMLWQPGSSTANLSVPLHVRTPPANQQSAAENVTKDWYAKHSSFCIK